MVNPEHPGPSCCTGWVNLVQPTGHRTIVGGEEEDSVYLNNSWYSKTALQELYDVISRNMAKQPDGNVIVAG